MGERVDNGVPLQHSGQREAARKALDLWLPNATLHFTETPQGTSGAELVGVDVSGDTTGFAVGGYVLRVGPPDDRLAQRNELAASALLRDADPAFADEHIPRLLRIHPTGEGDDRLVVTLHQLAGGSLSRYVAPRTQSTGLRKVARRVARDVLTAWSDPNRVRAMTPHELLVELVGEDRARECLGNAEHYFTAGLYNDESGYPVLDPREILGPGRSDSVPVMGGCCHGDLHNRNLLVPRDEQAESDTAYWIVDTDRAHDGAAGFDLAYLEVSVLVNLMQDIRLSTLHRCLTSVESVASRTVPDGTDWLMAFLRESREGIQEWILEQTGRLDQLACQFMLLRVIAGLLWARRFSPGSPAAKICLVYAGWYAQRYRRATAEAAGLLAPPGTSAGDADSAESEAARREAAEAELWESVWDSVSGFSQSAARYVLIAERMPDSASVAALGRIPWSLIVDMDPRSDHDGLYHRAGPVLEAQRAVHLFTREQLPTDYGRGTAWNLAVGSVRRKEQPDELRTWVYKRLNPLRQLVSSFQQSVGDAPVRVLVLEGDGSRGFGTERERLLLVIDAVDEALQGKGTFLHLGPTKPAVAAELSTVPLRLSALLDRLAETLGTTPDEVDYTVPAADRGTAALAPETMQKLWEHLVVLHDGIELTVPPAEGRHNDEFWRGGLISWADLDQRRDLPRTIAPSLATTLRDSLEEHRTRTVLLEHKPGTGGTTLALRAAWDLHHEYPVAVLPHGVVVDRARVPLIADRLNLLYRRTQKPVLLVAESGDLSESDREALYQELGKRGTHTTVLYVRRGVSGSGSSALVVDEHLNATETADFERRYSELVDERARISELKRLSRKSYKQYRTPFFYGLITFERKFTKLSDYVSSHLERVKGRAAEVMKYLALVTVYSNTGLQSELVHRLMRLASPSAGLELADVLGPGAARLVVVRSGRVRLQHQLIAEQALACLYDDEQWQYHLKDLAIDFIEALTHTTDVSSDPVRVLLQQMFVIRQSGTVDSADDDERGDFSPLVERLGVDAAHEVLRALTHHMPKEPHFWNHLGRHQMYRLERDLDKAEEYVSHAVSLAEDDFIHHHTLGLTRRAILRQELTRKKSRGVTAVMGVIDEYFEWTVDCFETSRRLNPENLYAYITHVQTIITAARTLKAAARVNSVAQLDSRAGDWVAEQIGEANALLHEATRVRGTLDDQDRFVVECRTGIDQLYDDLDAVVETWEVASTGRRSNPMVQRALAQAYYVRAGRRWRSLSAPELRRIVELARRNLSRHDGRAEDYRLWFEAFKELPEFDADQALSLLDGWLDRLSAWRGHYYRYCLLFHLWFKGLSDDTAEFREAQRISRELVSGRPKQSYLWFAKAPGGYTLIADSDLGEWDRKKNFWKNTEPLRRVNGQIDVMHSLWSGLIRLDGSVTAFFVPKQGDFLPDSDEEQEVNFYLGMSPDGLQAWEARPGHLPDAVSARSAVETELPRLVPAEPDRETIVVSSTVLAARAEEIRDEQQIEFLLSLLLAWQEVGQTPRLSALTERLRALYRHDVDIEALLDRTGRIRYVGGDDPEVLLDDAPRRPGAHQSTEVAPPRSPLRSGRRVLGQVVRVQESTRTWMVAHSGGLLARVRPEDVPEPDATTPRHGQLIWLEPELDRRGQNAARDVQLLPLDSTLVDDELVPGDQLRERLEGHLRDQMDAWTSQGSERVSETEVVEWLEEQFVGAIPLAERLGIGHLSSLWGELDWLRCRTGDGGRFLSLESRAVFGRLGFDGQPDGEARARPRTPSASFGAALAEAVDHLREQHGTDPEFPMVTKRLRHTLGRKKYYKVVGPDGGRSLHERILAEPGWEVVDRPGRPGRIRRTPERVDRGAASSDEALLEAVVRDMRAKESGPYLSDLGEALRARLAEDYPSVVGRSLTAWVNSQPGWEAYEVRPGHRVARRRNEESGNPDQLSSASASLSQVPVVEPADIAADLAAAIDSLVAEGREAAVVNVGHRLVERWGVETYRAVVGRPGLRRLAQKYGYEAVEIGPGMWSLRRIGEDEAGGSTPGGEA
ncbi:MULTISPECIES: hypothetical protein [unclassified Streptomyces]|uniref:hypothetical protein n=1 Tax=unclassified Streptomyces TaxID=2593676 RepID=UPI0037F154E6